VLGVFKRISRLRGSELKDRKVILITGPAGSGKTSLAERIAQNETWILVSEDVHWVEIKKGHPAGEYRTPEEQNIVQPAVVLQIRELLSKGNRVVIEFINYENPPKPLIYYYEALQRIQCDILVKVLRPSETVIMARKKIRGRADDQDYEQELKYTRHQLTCLESSYIKDEWIIDNSDQMVEEVYAKYFLAFVEKNA
jgi:adenylate kinase family enzyme